MAWQTPALPYNALPNLPPAQEVETAAVLKEAIRANRYLAELKGSCLRLPKPEILLNTIVLQESKESSAIENIVTTQDALYQAILNPSDGIATEVKEVLRYREALYAGLELMQRTGLLRSATAVVVMQHLRGVQMGYRAQPGTQLSNPATRQTVYTPPEADFVPDKMAAWERFLNEEDVYDPLVRMALLHYQFEAIHPFSDGNGRTGRIMNVLYLMYAGLLTQPILYHSSYIIAHKADYYRLLRGVTEHDGWEEWTLFMLRAVADTAQLTLRFIDRMLALREETLIEIRSISQKLPAYELNELLFSFPYVKIKTLTDRGLGTRPTVSGYLAALVEKQILQPLRLGREVYYINHRLMALLTNP